MGQQIRWPSLARVLEMFEKHQAEDEDDGDEDQGSGKEESDGWIGGVGRGNQSG